MKDYFHFAQGSERPLTTWTVIGQNNSCEQMIDPYLSIGR